MDFFYNVIKCIENNIFKGLWKFFDLWLNGNKIGMFDNLDRNVFVDLKNIKYLDLFDNLEFIFWIMLILMYGLRKFIIEILWLNKIYCIFGLSIELRRNDLKNLKYINLIEIYLLSNWFEMVE